MPCPRQQSLLHIHMQKVSLLSRLLKLKIQRTSKGLTLESLTYHSHCVCPEPNADRLNLGLQTGDSTI